MRYPSGIRVLYSSKSLILAGKEVYFANIYLYLLIIDCKTVFLFELYNEAFILNSNIHCYRDLLIKDGIKEKIKCCISCISMFNSI